jgi:phage-related protein
MSPQEQKRLLTSNIKNDISPCVKSRKPIFWLGNEIKTPPFSSEARQEVGFLLGRLQDGVVLSMPHLRPMPSLGGACYEIRVNSTEGQWRILLRIDEDAIIIADVFQKKTQKTPQAVIAVSKKRLALYDKVAKGG